MALIARRQQRFWMTNLKHVQRSLLQEPFCPPQPLPPKIVVPVSQFDQHLLSLLQYQTYTDLILSIGKSGICAHKVVLSAASNEFYKLFTMDITAGTEYNNPIGYWGRSASDSSIGSSTTDASSVANFNADTEQLISSSPAGLVDSGHFNKLYMFRASQMSRSSPPPFNVDSSFVNSSAFRKRSSFHNPTEFNSFKTGVHKTLNHQLFQSISIEHGENVLDYSTRLAPNVQTIVSISNVITLSALQAYIRFIYSGSLNLEGDTPLSELYDIAEYLGLQELQIVLRDIDNVKESDVYFNQSFFKDFSQKMKRKFKTICLDEGLFAGLLYFKLISLFVKRLIDN
jgi:Rho-related BTB domain-containing protein 1/2